MHRGLLLFLFVSFSISVAAQGPIGIGVTNYGGINNVSVNPAIAGSRFKVDVNLISGSFFQSSSLYPVGATLADFNPENWNNLADRYDATRAFGGGDRIAEGFTVQGPSALYAFGKNRDNRWAVGVSTHANHAFSVVNPDADLFAFSALNVKPESFFKGPVTGSGFGVSSLTWIDFGLTGSRVVYTSEKSSITAGLTLKGVRGIHGFHFSSDDLSVTPIDSDSMIINIGSASYARSIQQDLSTSAFENFSDSHPWSAAADIGITYSFHPDLNRNRYLMDNETFMDHQDAPHLLQIGASITNLGSIKFNQDTNVREVKNFSQALPSGFETNPEGVASFFNYTIDDFDTHLDSLGATNAPSSFQMKLPTMINVFADVMIPKGFGFNLAYYRALAKVEGAHFGPINSSALMLTPKYEDSVFGVYAPVRIDPVTGISLGVSLRIAGFFVGTNDVMSMISRQSSDRKYAGVHFGLRVPIRYSRLKDVDGDKVSDKIDACKSEKGPWIAKGCPDIDLDGVPNIEDDCPEEAGMRDLKGCPDSDGDGIINKLDFCPDVAGPAEGTPKMGCPDEDKDGFIEAYDEDKCPGVYGERDGCPDRDGDGVFDHEDGCPDAYGLYARGCPDTDGDGLADDEDSCKDLKGPTWNSGCPAFDNDRDGIYEPFDLCPDVPGVEPDGCPPPTKIPLRIIYGVVYFTESSTLTPAESAKIAELAAILAEPLDRRADYTIRVVGHTDPNESPSSKERVSLSRASEVKYVLIRAGIDEERILIEGVGDQIPHKVKSFPVGKYPDRRAEIFINSPPREETKENE